MKRLIVSFLVFAILLSACGANDHLSFKDKTEATTEVSEAADDTADNSQNTTDISDDGTDNSDNATDSSGDASDSDADNNKANIVDDREPETFEFNTHIHSDILSEYVKEEWWQSFYNMCDAMRAGESTFACTDEEAYKWCTDDVTIGDYFPAACTLVTGAGYADGVGTLEYKMPAEEFVEREKAFEEEICRMLSESIHSDYTTFEKCVSIYDYMANNFVYDYGELDGQGVDDFSNYACLMKKDGICTELASAYVYMLLQCGVDAAEMSGDGDAGYHAWALVDLDGKYYYCDLTWDLTPPELDSSLQYFMETEQERLNDGFNEDDIFIDIFQYVGYEYDHSKYTPTDEKFKPLHSWASYSGIDRGRKMLVYRIFDGPEEEMSYE